MLYFFYRAVQKKSDTLRSIDDIDWKWILVILIWNEQYADWTENYSWKVFHNLRELHDLSFLFFKTRLYY